MIIFQYDALSCKDCDRDARNWRVEHFKIWELRISDSDFKWFQMVSIWKRIHQGDPCEQITANPCKSFHEYPKSKWFFISLNWILFQLISAVQSRQDLDSTRCAITLRVRPADSASIIHHPESGFHCKPARNPTIWKTLRSAEHCSTNLTKAPVYSVNFACKVHYSD